MLRTLLITAAATCVVAAPATAATVSYDGKDLRVTDAAAERNDITVTSTDTQTHIADAGAALTIDASATGCTAVPDGVLCDFWPKRILVSAGAGDDDVRITQASAMMKGPVGVPAVLSGGPGNDTLLGGWKDDGIEGGDGYDIAQCGGGTDTGDAESTEEIQDECEFAGDPESLAIHREIRTSGRRGLAITLRCTPASFKTCMASVEIRIADRTVGRRTTMLRAGQTKTVRVPTRRDARKLIRSVRRNARAEATVQEVSRLAYEDGVDGLWTQLLWSP